MSIGKIERVNLYKLAAEKMLRPLEEFKAAYLEENVGVNAQDSFGFTLLHYAVARGRSDVVEFLLSEGANPVIVNNKGETALDLAKAKYDIIITRADQNPIDLYLEKDKSGIIERLSSASSLQLLPSEANAVLEFPDKQKQQQQQQAGQQFARR